MRSVKAPDTEPSIGAVRYIHKPSKLNDTMAGPSDLAGFIDPLEMGLSKLYKTIVSSNLNIKVKTKMKYKS